jgi:hypothetical protein
MLPRARARMVSPMSTSNPLVVLRNGLSVPVDAVELLLALERRGLDVRFDGDGLTVGPRTLLTDQDRDAIRAHKQSLIALTLLCDEVVQ